MALTLSRLLDYYCNYYIIIIMITLRVIHHYLFPYVMYCISVVDISLCFTSCVWLLLMFCDFALICDIICVSFHVCMSFHNVSQYVLIILCFVISNCFFILK